ncbi:GGDEF domain-containing protein [Phenylobacterium sp.]|uniref:GGDEF domain-containing protein n=1 Tax=Phenylobacterium sp. TaxID=1871053 RepID=UPI0027330111|nr:GGDEF domain-containing protein [Phenylobacterium sp.]MDP3659999.1 GGDEF domain-containing protein [Phenylobacterium sp.]
MRITGARTDPYAAGAAAPAAPQARAVAAPAQAAPVDRADFLGVGAAELTPAVQAALTALLSELESLRGEVTRLKEQLGSAMELADRDALTPLLNRRAFLRELHRVRTFAQRYGGPASLVYFDLDGFKSVNDRFGHAAGDAALQAVAERLSANVRESDVVGRMGGDEFAVILVQADAAAAEAKAQALVAAIEAAPIEFGEWTAPLHVSYGVTQIEPDSDPEATLAIVDAAMFARKRARREG